MLSFKLGKFPLFLVCWKAFSLLNGCWIFIKCLFCINNNGYFESTSLIPANSSGMIVRIFTFYFRWLPPMPKMAGLEALRRPSLQNRRAMQISTSLGVQSICSQLHKKDISNTADIKLHPVLPSSFSWSILGILLCILKHFTTVWRPSASAQAKSTRKTSNKLH